MDYRLGAHNKRNSGANIDAGMSGKTRNGMARWRVGVDSGGTFTDICLFDEQAGRVETWKVPSTPDDPSRGIAEGVEEGMRRVAPEAQRTVRPRRSSISATAPRWRPTP